MFPNVDNVKKNIEDNDVYMKSIIFLKKNVKNKFIKNKFENNKK